MVLDLDDRVGDVILKAAAVLVVQVVVQLLDRLIALSLRLLADHEIYDVVFHEFAGGVDLIAGDDKTLVFAVGDQRRS